jgi:hypothetical protein
MKRFPWFEALLVAAILTINGYAASSDAYNFPNAWFTRDDAYYYFKVAQNISEGHGSSFDGINSTNGYHPLWMLVCIPIFALARFDVILPLRVLVIVLSLLNAATAILIFRLLSMILSPPAAVLASAYWAFSPHLQHIVYALGLEAGIGAFFVVTLVVAIFRLDKDPPVGGVSARQIAWVGALALLAVLSRLDLIFLALLAGLWITFKGFPLRYLLMADLPLLYFALVLGCVLRSGMPDYFAYSRAAAMVGLAAVAVKIPVLYAFGLYRHPKTLPVLTLMRRSILAISIGEVLLAAIVAGLERAVILPAFPLSALALDWGLGLIAVMLSRRAAAWFSQNRDPLPNPPFSELKAHWRGWLRMALAYYSVLAAGLGLYMLWNKLAFETFTPVSGQIKYWWGTFGASSYDGPPRNWVAFLAIEPRGGFDAWPLVTLPITDLGRELHFIFGAAVSGPRYSFLMAILIAAIVVALLANPRRAARAAMQLGLPLLLAGSAMQIFPYTTLAYASVQEWYWISQLVLTVLLGALLADLAFARLGRLLKSGIPGQSVSLGLAALMAVLLGSQVGASMPHGATAPGAPLMDVVSFLEKNTPPGAAIGMTGGGNVGYFIRGRTIVNMDGLINSYEYFLALKTGTGADYLYDHRLGYVFANQGLLRIPPYSGQFEGRLARFTTYGGKSLSVLLPADGGNP